MSTLFRTPHLIYKKYQTAIESMITALGLALLVATVLVAIPVYPPNWAPVLVALVIIVALRWPLAAYILAVAAVLYPVYSVSLYLAIISLALAVIGHRPFSHYLGAAVLVLSAPLLAEYNLHWAVPILAGFWWGTFNGFWIGGAAALWGKLIGGMAGLNIDWFNMAGQAPSAAGIMQRFNGLGALDTLLKLLEPFAANTTILLYHILQIAVWALVAALAGFLAHQKLTRYQHPWSTLIIAAIGITVMAVGQIMLLGWLTEAAPVTLNYSHLATTALIGFAVSSLLEITRKSLDLPLAPKARKPVKVAPSAPRQSNLQPAYQTAPAKQAPVQLPNLPEWKPPDENNDLILLELD